MKAEERRHLHRLEGLNINVALADGSRLDDVMLICARTMSLWVFTGGEDRFIPLADVIDAWPAGPAAA